MRGIVILAVLAAMAAPPVSAAKARRKPAPARAVLADPAAFIPPDDADIERSFWEVVYRLERRQTGSTEADPLADAMRIEVAGLKAEERLAVMRLFLAATHHYDGMEDGTLVEALRQRHEERFSDRLRDFAILSSRLRENGGASAGKLFARVRALAGPGAAGLELSRRLADADPGNASVLTRLSMDLADTGDLQGSVEAAEKAIAVSSDSPRARTALASAKYQLKDFPGANAAANEALSRDPGDKVAYAIVTLTQDRLPAARKAAESSPLDLADDTGGTRRDAVGGAIAPPLPGAAAAARDLAEEARASLRGGDFERADELATKALEKDPNSVAALFRRARARMRREQLDEAYSDTARALELMGPAPSPILLTLHAGILNRLGRSAEGLAAAERALTLNPGSDRSVSGAMFQKAWGLAGTGDRRGAMKTLAQAARLNQRYVPFYQEAKSQPEEQDLTLVFASDWLAQESVPSRGGEPEKAQSLGELLGPRRTMLILVFSLLGGGLIAFGLVRSALSSRAAATEPVPAAPAPAANGLLAGTYRLGRRIGSGGMGLVFEALDVNLERRVAIKKMREEIGADPRERERFLREARTVAALKHPNIVEIHAVVGDGQDVYLVFEHVDGHTVTEYLQAYRRIPFDQAVRIVMGVTAALDYAHARGVVHRDLKPSNIMITREGVVKVMDFGIARQAKDTLSALHSTETISGTPQYMPPEQEAGSVRGESDVYSLGVCLYEMVAGVLPFQGVGVNMSINKAKRAYSMLSHMVPDLPPGTDQVMDWALDPDPDRRLKTPQKFSQALQDLLQPRIGLKPPDQIASA
ncbi:MAG: protein kinase [Elusimicrobia bacterium]|nr:protein kinase [Elusimicrobiota bacterium]